MHEIKHYCQDTIVEALKRLIAQSSICRVAVAYCGSAAYKFFPESPASWPADLRIIVDASDSCVRRGLTNPKGLEHLLGLTSQLRSLEGLHAKAFIFDEKAAIVGSVNLSDSSITQQYQLALEVSDPLVVRELIAWFDQTIWEKGDSIDSIRLNKLNGLWPGSDSHVPTGNTKGKLREWRGGPPQPPLGPSDFSIGLPEEKLARLLLEFKRNKCAYSRINESCLEHARAWESGLKARSDQFHLLMKQRDSWNRSNLGTIFDLAYTNGKAAKMKKPLFVKLNPATVARNLTFLLQGDGDPYIRFEKLLDSKGSYKCKGLGPTGLIFLLYLWKPDVFPIINGSIEMAFKILKVKFRRGLSEQYGQWYKDRSAVIREIMNFSGLKTFALMDHFLDGIGKGHFGLTSS